MNFKFYINRLGYPAVDCDESIYPVAWVLTDNAHCGACNEILQEISNVRNGGVAWEMSYNKSVLNISDTGIICMDAFNEARCIKLKLDRFETLIGKWKDFLSDKKNENMAIKI